MIRPAPALLMLVLAACQEPPRKPSPPPAHAEPIASESELLKLTLTPRARQRLGIVIQPVGGSSARQVRQVTGEIVVPPTAAGGVPTNSLTNLAQVGSQQAIADGEVARTEAQARLARIALTRAEALVREEAGSVRARDEAAAALAAAQAALGAARQQQRLLGPAVAALGDQSVLWVRASVFASDVGAVVRGAEAMVRPLGSQGRGKEQARGARPVQAPPSADSAAGTVDLYYALGNRDRQFRVGQRVAVELPLAGRTASLSVPSSAIVRDIYGGEWVYRMTSKDAFVRQRIEVVSESGGQALLARGLEPGAQVVTVGAAELFGTEFGAAH
ncbi:efflux RND transporter periplasmic adaptor subunit [Novosphingobium sp. ZW T3_23]|uniref:efflux RND transporter periplasmic adaptor subunit n=1 Tax=Novosphingobium sp. ZW T3_23 TaxID=3378084 RepID=UPI003853026C